jgi:hypothetical protein
MILPVFSIITLSVALLRSSFDGFAFRRGGRYRIKEAVPVHVLMDSPCVGELAGPGQISGPVGFLVDLLIQGPKEM